jgi:uncharacterized repeat protein (TIGR03806 family)
MVRLMTSVRLLGLALVTAATFSALGACGTDEAASADDPNGADGGALPDGFVPPTRAEFGLETRPSNTTCLAPARPPSTAPVKFERVFANVSLGLPMILAQIPGDASRWFVAQRGGTIVSFPTAAPGNTPTLVGNVANVAGKTIALAGEGGLLGMAFHPKFAQNGLVYITWTRAPVAGDPPSAVNMISEVGVLHSPDNGASFDSYTVVIPGFGQPATNHNGGGIAFGKDGFLYLGFGDGGGGEDGFHNGQTTTGFFSKVLRIDVDSPSGGKQYGIPDGNPYKNGGGEPAVFARGFRNPFRLSIDRDTNDLWVGDVGQNTFEEIDAKVKVGGNYGWPCREGMHDSLAPLVNPPNAGDPAKCPPGTLGLVDPVAEHKHTPANSRSITGGVVYRGKAVPGFVGSYVYGDYAKQELWTLSFDPGTGEAKTTQLPEPAANWVSFTEDNDGELYAVALNQGAVYKLVAAEPQGPSTFPDRLSKTGCTDPSDVKKPAAGLVPFGVQAPLWSDGALKERFLAIPDGTTISVKDDDGDFDFPNSTVLVKTFSLGGKRIETRLFIRHDDGGWNGYSYEWLDDQSDAVLLPAGKSKTIGAQTWAYPSRNECVTCHSEAAGRALGPELGQLNGDYVYASTNLLANQLKTLDHIGMFDKPLGKPVDQLVAFPDPYGTGGSLELRARAYLHSNCANCHRPKGGGLGNLDLRFGTAFKDTVSCDVEPEAGDIGVAGAKLLTPGDPSKSLLSLRPHSPAANRMPPLGSSVVDAPGLKVLDDWITSVTACP